MVIGEAFVHLAYFFLSNVFRSTARSTKFRWHAGPEDPLDFGVSAQSVTQVTWAIPSDASEGTYRLCYFGDHKIAKTSAVVPFTGCSSTFTVSA
jgi:hypothetical protein